MKYKVTNKANGDEHWKIQLGGDFEYHREVGPAIRLPAGSKIWYKNGKLHRGNDLPAAVFFDGTKEWWIENRFIKEEIVN